MGFLEPGEGVEEILLGAFFLADVAAHADKAEDAAGAVAEGDLRRGNPAAGAVVIDDGLLAILQGDAGREDGIVIGMEAFRDILGEKIEDGFANDVAGGFGADVAHVSEVVEDVAAFAVLDVNAVGQGVDEGAEEVAVPGAGVWGLGHGGETIAFARVGGQGGKRGDIGPTGV